MRLSVVLTVYNASWCIERALDSVMGQTRPPEEVLLCDDGSTDGTPDLVEGEFGSRVQVLRLPHRNASATRREGLARATGDWFCMLDADDRWVPDKLERQLAYLARHPEVRFLSSDGVLESADGVVRESWLADYFDPVREMVGDLLPPLVERCFPLVSSMMFEREAYEAVGGFDPAMVYSHDYDLWMRLAARYPGALMSDRLIQYFTSPGALSRNFEARYRDDLELMRRIERGGLGHRPELERLAAERAAALEFDLALLCLKSGRVPEGHDRMRRAMLRGPLRRRLLAAAGAWLPPALLRRLVRSSWLKLLVQGARRSLRRIDDRGPAGKGGA